MLKFTNSYRKWRYFIIKIEFYDAAKINQAYMGIKDALSISFILQKLI